MTEATPTTESKPHTAREAKARTLLQIAATTTAVGILLAAAGDASLSRWLTLAGLALLVVGLHRFGRLGADDPSDPRRLSQAE